ncbi:MAG: cyclic nucleotide-binding domain-containing protein [Deltaproteobacteria bacterium]|nr:cyclic nucleotide-binding domain-containing protein [Deltaproteobacteria bacterium]
MTARALLSNIIPFRFLRAEVLDQLASDLRAESFEAGQTIIEQGAHDDRVFLLESGTVDTYDGDQHFPEARIYAGTYFGERAALFDERRSRRLVASERCAGFSMTGDRFLALLEQPVFAHALGDILRHKQGIFTGFRRFVAELERAAASGGLALDELLPLYRGLLPALHPFVGDPETIDFPALGYAIRRLPDNLTTTLSWFLTSVIPEFYRNPDQDFSTVRTDGRRRAVYELMPGKNMVLLRDALSDLSDLVSCLCLYAIEAGKLRRRLKGSFDALLDESRRGLEDLPFDAEEAAELDKLWTEPRAALRNAVLHHEDFVLHIDSQLVSYNPAASERWIGQIAAATRELWGCDASALPADVEVHVISSNTHSVTNCLSAALADEGEAIIDWATRCQHPLLGESWGLTCDRFYALSRDYWNLHPERARERVARDRTAGILHMDSTAFTGLEVDIIDTGALAEAGKYDPKLPEPARRSLVVNIDYAFGQQASEIIGALISLFSTNLASVSVLGKAGGLVGKRGDVFVPSLFIDEKDDALHPVSPADKALLEAIGEGSFGVHQGPTLTVTGTLLQNPQMLHYYRRIYGCVGLEMEGSYYHGKILEAISLGRVRPDLRSRYAYYVSDLPLDHDSNLSGRMAVSEGVPPLYAITRGMLAGVLA